MLTKPPSPSTLDCVFETIDSTGGIYISNYIQASQKQLRKKYNIKAVISIAYNGYITNHDQLIDYLYIPAEDTCDYHIMKHFQDTFLFIDKYRRLGNVLVHCMVGKSRSATIVAAFLLKKYKYSLSDVMTLLTRKRKIIKPNPGFLKQLQQYCIQLGIPKGQDLSTYFINKHKKQKHLPLSKSFTTTSTNSYPIDNHIKINKSFKLLTNQSKLTNNQPSNNKYINNNINIKDNFNNLYINKDRKNNSIYINWKTKKSVLIQ